jgi:lipopolysaccharide/colanic/teichoic acid biosynthesis glycosyltransferase
MLDVGTRTLDTPGARHLGIRTSSDPAGSPQSSARRRTALGAPERAATRAFDIAFALAASVLTAPIVLAAMIAIRLESPGPALFRQRRMGRYGEEFEMFKLRGMYVDAPARFPALYDYAAISHDTTATYYFHHDGDPRVTRVGRLIRRYSIDELPNFWNVVRGDMSIVGPRPEIPELAHLYGPSLDRLLSVRPGVTSPAKACGRDTLSFAETLERDLRFVERHTFRDDVHTIALTVRAVRRASDVC